LISKIHAEFYVQEFQLVAVFRGMLFVKVLDTVVPIEGRQREVTMARLDGKISLITGAAGGIGTAAARLFAEEGARLLLIDREKDAVSALADDLGAGVARVIAADVSDADAMKAAVQAAVDGFGGLDIALLNAGIEGRVLPIEDYPVEEFDRVIAVNVRGVWLGVKYAMPVMRARGGGSIVITSSIAGVRGRPGLSAYVTSKHAVVGLMRTAALEGVADGVRVNTINPSPVETRMMRSLEAQSNPGDPEAHHRRYAADSPMGRYATPEEIARTMLFLASDDSSHSTGGVYMVDGGRSAR